MRKFVRKWMCAAALLLAVSLTASAQKVKVGDLHVIPLPQEVSMDAETYFPVTSSTQVVYPSGNKKVKKVAELLRSYVKNLTGVEVQLTTKLPGKSAIRLMLDKSIANAEGYEISIQPEEVVVKGATEAAVFHGVQLLHKALPLPKGEDITPAWPCGTVKDYPRFGYRAFMIDVGRHYFPVDYLKEMIDVMAMHNINYFHWHLTEDQGWRLEIKKYPKLVEIGSKRKATLVKWEPRQSDNTPYEGYYTQKEAREIVRYAAERFITVIPEIDLPGHTLAALASYPELGCTGGPYEVATVWGVFPDVLCGGSEKSLRFAKDVLKEVLDIFPSKYVHIGGDECPKKRWEKCPKCQAKIKELGLVSTPKHSKENQLQTYFMAELEKYLNKHGRSMLGWDEMVDGGLTPNATVISWRSMRGGIEAARQHHNVVAAPISNLYFSNPGYNKLTGVASVERVYNFEPVPSVLTPEEKKYIIGAEGCIWTEWTRDSLKMEWQMMPRIAALCEIQWTQPEKKNLNNFLKRLDHQLDLYTAYGLHYKQDIREASITTTITLSTYDNAPIYYTLDGSEPTQKSKLYKAPFKVGPNQKVRAAAFRNGKMDIIQMDNLSH